jgi:iron(III) transport system permease protein
VADVLAPEALDGVFPARLRRTWRPSPGTLAFTAVLLAVGLVTLYPLALLVAHSFEVGVYGQATTIGLDNWVAALTQPRMQSALINTLTLAVTRQAISLVIGVGLAWLLARTDLPGRNWLEFGFWVAVFLPTLTVTLGWILLLDGHQGLVNQLLATLPGKPSLDIFSWWGIVFVHLMTGTLASKVMLLTPAFRNMDAAMEEASRMSGASALRTLVRIVLPVMAPALIVVTLLGTIRSLEAFEIELILGSSSKIDVYSTLIYRQVYQSPPQYGTATALSMLVVLLLVPFIVLQQRYIRRGTFTTVSGKYSSRIQKLGAWRWLLFGLVAALLVFMDVVPAAFVLLSTVMKVFGFFSIQDPFTLTHWVRALSDAHLVDALKNTLVLGFSAAGLGMILFLLLAYMSVRARFSGTRLLDFLTWIPTTIPGIVLGLGFLWLFLGTPIFRPLYGTIFILIAAVVLGTMTEGVQLIKTNLVQLGAELEEASWVSGAPWLYTLGRVVLPLVAPAVAVVGVLTFATAARATSIVALLASRDTQPLSLVQLGHMADGDFEKASVIGVLMLLLTIGVALTGRLIGLRIRAAT